MAGVPPIFPNVQSRHHECAMCMETFNSPRLLPCFHTFCLGCLKQLLQHHHKTNSFPCPTCRTSIDIPPGGVGKFQVNFYIEAEVEAKRSGTIRTCEMCGKGPSTHKCSDCDQFACDSCTAIHATIKATKSHTVLSLQNTTASGTSSVAKVTKERYCSTHKEEKIRFFCTKCSTVICRDCKLTAHENHKTTDLSQKSSEARKLVLEITNRSRNNLDPKLRKALLQAEKQEMKVQERKKTIERTIDQRAEELKKEIDKSVAMAKTKLNQETGDADKIVSRCIDSMTQELACFLSLTEHAQCLAKSGCDADVLEIPTQMKLFFGTSSKQAFQQKPVSSYAISEPAPLATSTKLKSFTKQEWRQNIQLDAASGLKQCTQCSCQYDQNMDVCPECGTGDFDNELYQCQNCQFSYDRNDAYCPQCEFDNPAHPDLYHSHPNYGSYYAGSWDTAAVRSNVQCKNCRRMYAQNSGSCPSCGTQESQSHTELMTTIKNTVPQYIGHVTRTSQSQDSANEDSLDLELRDARQRAVKGRRGCGVQPVGSHQSSTSSLSNDISAEINHIQTLLSKWQSSKKQ